jgi:hypothetical protein
LASVTNTSAVTAAENLTITQAMAIVLKDVAEGRANPGRKGWARARALALMEARKKAIVMGTLDQYEQARAAHAKAMEAKKEELNKFFWAFMENPAFRSGLVDNFVLDEENGTAKLFLKIEVKGKVIEAVRQVNCWSSKTDCLHMACPPGNQYFGSGGYSCGIRGSENVDKGKSFSDGFISGRNDFEPVDPTQPAWLVTSGMSCMDEGESWKALHVYIPGWGWLK